MKILVGYVSSPGPQNRDAEYRGWIGRLRKAGFNVSGICLSLNPPSWNLTWPELEWRWRHADRSLMTLYEELGERCSENDVFLNYSGVNVHPDFVRQLSTLNVYSCFDDPESSRDLSKPAAWAYDVVLVGNIAEVDTYRRWGMKDPQWWPLGFRESDYNPALTEQAILNGERDVDLTLLCERSTLYRRSRLDRIARALPRGRFYGRNWPAGYLPEDERVPLLQRTKMGINVHHSTGPINFRTYYLPANGVLQICDNKLNLGKIFELNREVLGFDSIDEGIELCRYYLAHDRERREVAARGWARAIRDYNEVACFQRAVLAAQGELTKRASGTKEGFDLGLFRAQYSRRASRRLGRIVSMCLLEARQFFRKAGRRVRALLIS